MIIGRGPSLNWREINGTYGEFKAPGTEIRVAYLLTYASLGSSGTANTALANELLPVRELFDVGEMDFNELLQRDIDDFRVANDIIPYLLENSEYVRFFPPILSVILPALNNRIIDYYDAPGEPKEESIEHYIQETSFFGESIKLRRYKVENGYDDQAVLSYNPDKTKLVVIDGQHRAMAMLAIRRTKQGSWGDKGADFKHFYEDIAENLKDKDILQKLDKVEMPVCICFFPDITKENESFGQTTKLVCRKLFLDVNRTAKRPTKARILLLDDSSLLCVFTRVLMAEIRERSKEPSFGTLSIDSFEYDSPKESSIPRREIAFISVEMLHEIINWLLFALDKYYCDLEAKPQGRPFEPKCERLLREISFDKSVKHEEFKVWGYDNIHAELDPKLSKTASHRKISELFMQVWGEAIIKVLSKLHPFASHTYAVASIKEKYASETGPAMLAHRALFDGQGILWAVQYYSQERKKLRDELKQKGIPCAQHKIEYVDECVRKWIKEDFYPIRARAFLKLSKKEVPNEKQLDSSKRSYETFRTQAFQIGVFMAFAYLKEKLKLDDKDEFLNKLDTWISAWNSVFQNKTKTRLEKSLSLFDRDPVPSNGMMARYQGSLKPTDWYWFRYFTFEILLASKEKFSGEKEVHQAVNILRRKFLKFLVKKYVQDQKKLGKEIGAADATKEIKEMWGEALNYSLGVTRKDYDNWYAKEYEKIQETREIEDTEDELIETDEEINDAYEEINDSVEDIKDTDKNINDMDEKIYDEQYEIEET